MLNAEDPHFRSAVKRLLGVEGDFSDHADDPGGATRYGITEAQARRYGYDGPMRDLPLETALAIYYASYWRRMGCHAIVSVRPQLAEELFECGVNVGTRRAVRWMQRALNALNRQGRDWRDIAVDGWWGPDTSAALMACHRRRGSRGPRAVERIVDALQGHHYVALCEADPDFESFCFGWVDKRID